MKIVTGQEVWHWPEFQAFIKRLGVPIDQTLTKAITFIIDEDPDALVKVIHTYHGIDTGAISWQE